MGILGIMGWILAAMGWLTAIVGLWLAFRRLRPSPSAPPPSPPVGQEEAAQLEEEAAARTAQLQEWGRQGAEKRKAQAAEFQACMIEGRALIAAPGGIEEKKAALMGLIQKYPQVAESVARKLNREMGLSKRLGVPEDMLLQEVAGLVKNALAAKEGQGESAAPPPAAPTPQGRGGWPVTLLH